MTRPPFTINPALLEAGRRFNAALEEALVNLNRRLKEATAAMPATAYTTDDVEADLRDLGALLRNHDRMSADHPGDLLTIDEAVTTLPRYLGPVLTEAGIRARGWDLVVTDRVPAGRIRVRPAALRVEARDAGDVIRVLEYAEHRRQAARALRRIVVDVAFRAGLTDLRPFARPVGADR